MNTEFVFVVVEQNTESVKTIYPEAYATFSLAADAVKSKYKKDLLEQGDDFGAISALNSYRNPTYVYIEKGINIVIIRLPIKHGMAWVQDEECVGQDDPVSLTSIPYGRGFKLEAENRCYDAETLAQMKRLGTPLNGPLTRIPFTANDIIRIDNYIQDNPAPIGGKKSMQKIQKKRKTQKTRKTKKTRKTQKTGKV